MASLKAFLGKLLTPELVISAAETLAPGFRRLTLEGESLRGASFTPGDKVQVVLEGGTRTYTPFAFDPAKGTFDLLVYVHGDTPGAAWGRGAKAGERIHVFGPRGSIALDALAGPVLVTGDETSFAVARAQLDRGGAVAPVFEVTNVAESSAVLVALGLEVDLVARTPDEAHLDELEAKLRARKAHTLVLTGKAQTIQALRARLRARPPFAAQKTKGYWAPGKRGLD